MHTGMTGRYDLGACRAGLTSAIIDENIGVLNYILKRDGVVPHGPSYTVHLEVDYRKPIAAGSPVLCIAGEKRRGCTSPIVLAVH